MSLPLGLDEYTEQQLLRDLYSRVDARYYGKCDYCKRFRDEGLVCRFPRRHMMALTMEEGRRSQPVPEGHDDMG